MPKNVCVLVAQSCLILCEPLDYSLPGSPVRGIFQARVLEWGAIAFSDICILMMNNSNVRFEYKYSKMYIEKTCFMNKTCSKWNDKQI